VTHALIDRLIQDLGYEEITLDNHDSFTQRPGLGVLFFPGNPETVKDATDVAVPLATNSVRASLPTPTALARSSNKNTDFRNTRLSCLYERANTSAQLLAFRIGPSTSRRSTHCCLHQRAGHPGSAFPSLPVE